MGNQFKNVAMIAFLKTLLFVFNVIFWVSCVLEWLYSTDVLLFVTSFYKNNLSFIIFVRLCRNHLRKRLKILNINIVLRLVIQVSLNFSEINYPPYVSIL